MNKLRKKITFVAFAAVTVVFALAVIFTFVGLRLYNIRRSDGMTHLIEINNGYIPRSLEFESLDPDYRLYFLQIDDESAYRTRYFIVYFDEYFSVDAVNINHIASVDESEAVDKASEALEKRSSTGSIEEFRYRVTPLDSGGYSVVFVDCSEMINTQKSILVILSCIAADFVIIITVIFSVLSKKVVRPFEDNAKKQKQFITDASHELKTPLTIISANAEVLAYKYENNEWITNITDQVEKMAKLINELLTLTRLEEIDSDLIVEPINLSSIVNETASEFDENFERKNVETVKDIEDNIVINGNSEQLKRLVSLLTENASKYVSENGRLEISLHRESSFTILEIFNTCELRNDIDYSHLFDRFYRPDSSRTSKTGGHGIGLSIAREIVNLHGGTIEALPENDGLRFKSKISNRLKLNKPKKSELATPDENRTPTFWVR